MKIVLVNPSIDFEVAMGKIKNLSSSMVQIPLGISYLASYLRVNGFSEIEIIDSYAECLSIDKTVRLCIEKEPEILGIGCVTATYPIVCEIARKMKEERPGTKIVVGGEHPTTLPEETLANQYIDIVVRGEGEVTFLEIVRFLAEGKPEISKIAGISYKDNGRIVHNQSRDQIKDIDTIPFPAHDLLPMKLYNAPPHWEIDRPSFQMMTSRGCPHRCTFCSLGVMGKMRRARSPRNIFKEIEYLIDNYNARQIMFWDAIFPVSKREGMEFCKELIKSRIKGKIVWTTECRVNVVDEELLNLMYEAGCRIIAYGIESGVQRLLDNVKKKFTLDQARSAVKLTSKAKIRTYGTYIIGLPGETRDSIFQTLEFAKELDTDYAQFNVMVPYPGTQIFDEAIKNGNTNLLEWDKFIQASAFTRYDPVYVPDGMEAEELKTLAKRVYKKYYLRPGMLFKHLKYIRSFKDLSRYIGVGKALLKSL